MMLTGRHVPAKEGYELGFVTEVVPHAELMTAARRWAGQILECSPMSVRATKQVVMRSLDVPALEMAMRNLHYPAFVAMAQERGHGRRARRPSPRSASPTGRAADAQSGGRAFGVLLRSSAGHWPAMSGSTICLPVRRSIASW